MVLHMQEIAYADRVPRAKPAMKNRVVRVDDPTWLAAQARADEQGRNLSEVIRRLLVAYGKGADLPVD